MGGNKHYQELITKQLVKEVFRGLHGDFRNHPGFPETDIAYGERKYFPKKAQLVSNWVLSYEQCTRES